MRRRALLGQAAQLAPVARFRQGRVSHVIPGVEAAVVVPPRVADVERDLILDTLDNCLGNRTHAAKILGISIRTLRNKLNQYTDEGVPVPSPGEARVT